jgi:hypothetical protein
MHAREGEERGGGGMGRVYAVCMCERVTLRQWGGCGLGRASSAVIYT